MGGGASGGHALGSSVTVFFGVGQSRAQSTPGGDETGGLVDCAAGPSLG